MQQYRIVTVIIIELQNINHVNINGLKYLADMNSYFLENWKLWRSFTLYLCKDSILCFVNSRLLRSKFIHCQLPTKITPCIVL